MKLTLRGGFAALVLCACLALLGAECSDVLGQGSQAVIEAARAQRPLAMAALTWAPAAPVAAYLALFGLAVLGFAASVGLCLRRRATVGLLLLQLALGATTESDLFYLMAAELGLLLPFRAGLGWLAGLAAGLAASFLPIAKVLAQAHPVCNLAGLAPPPIYLDLLTDYVQEVALQAFAFCVGYFAQAQIRHHADLAEAHAVLLTAQDQLTEAVRDAEQQRIAHRLNDALGERLAELCGQVDCAAAEVAGPAAVSVATSQALAHGLAGEIGKALARQRAAGEIPLAQALDILCSGIPVPRVALEFDAAARVESPALAHTILRSVQEAISNIVRHSGAATARVVVARQRGGLAVSIHDDGRGADDAPAGNGLTGIGERVAGHGGRLQVGNRADGGFALDIWLPLEA